MGRIIWFYLKRRGDLYGEELDVESDCMLLFVWWGMVLRLKGWVIYLGDLEEDRNDVSKWFFDGI